MDERKKPFSKEKKSELVLFHETFTRLHGKLTNFCFYYLRDREESREIVQDVFLKLWEGDYNIEDLHKKSEIDSLLFTITRNKCLDSLRHKKVELKYNEAKREEYLSYAISEHALNDDNSLEFIISKDIENAINKAIKELPDSIRETFMLNRYNQMTYKEIAVHLSISEKTVEYRISRALKDLRSKLSPYNYMLLVILSENVVKSIKETL
ncbi:MAG TPA: hypothetical protein DEO54_00710 [Rikenellaceae bacterium]|nr:MAG: hypothetical protein A2X20_01340 [Bacteroidetes bacterium GWE2_40_15]HBZ24744.1 hypothetical protein [Rikenellaceae bacterium]